MITRNIFFFSGGNTFHAGLSLFAKYFSLSDQKLDYFRKYLEDLQVIVLDEISMIGNDKYYDISKRCQEIFINYDAFGGRAKLGFGDLMQLNAVNGGRTYGQPKSYQSKGLYFSKTENLWDNCESVVLETNHRQGDRNMWTETLNRLRFGRVSKEDATLLESRRSRQQGPKQAP